MNYKDVFLHYNSNMKLVFVLFFLNNYVRGCRLSNRDSSLPELDEMVFLLPLTGKQIINIFVCACFFCVFLFVFSEQKQKCSLSLNKL